MFNTFKKILTNQPIHQSDADKVSPFLLLRWLSGDPRLLGMANQINNTPSNIKLDNLVLCRGIQETLKGKIKFIKYPQSKKDKQYEIDVTQIAKYFEVSKTEAIEYYEWMVQHCPEEIDILKSYYRG